MDELSEDTLLVENKLVKVRLLLVVRELLVVVVVLEGDDPVAEFDGPTRILVPSAYRLPEMSTTVSPSIITAEPPGTIGTPSRMMFVGSTTNL